MRFVTTNNLDKWPMSPPTTTYPLLSPETSSLRSTTLFSYASTASSTDSSTHLQNWMYWQRYGKTNPNCWMKVFAVLKHDFLWLYRHQETSSKTLLLQVAIAKVDTSRHGSLDQRLLRVVDPNGEELELCLVDADMLTTWKERLEEAANRTEIYLRLSTMAPKELQSFYRGTLVQYRQVSKHERYIAAVRKAGRRWKKRLVARLEAMITVSDERR